MDSSNSCIVEAGRVLRGVGADDDPDRSILPEIVAQTEARGFGGRVSVGHITKLSTMARRGSQT